MGTSTIGDGAVHEMRVFEASPLVWTIAIAAASLALAAVWIVALALAGPSAYVAPLALVAMVAAAWVIASAVRGRRWASASLLAVCLVVPNISFQTHDLGVSSLNASNGAKLVIWSAAAAVAIGRWRQIVPFLSDDLIWPIAALGVIGVVSSSWSPTPAYTAASALEFLASLFFACLIAADLPAKSVYRIVLGSMVLYFAVTLAAGVISPDLAWVAPYEEGHSFRLQGVSSHPNMLAKEAAAFICLVTPLAIVQGRKSLRILASVVGLMIMFQTQSRTSLIAMAVALIAPFADRRSLRFALIAMIGLSAAGLFLWAFGGAPEMGTILSSAGRDSNDASELLTLTGRTELWGFVWGKIVEAPILGYGFNAAEATLSKDWWGSADQMIGPHNAWLQALLTLGLLGAALFVFWQIRLLRRWFQIRESATRLLTPYMLVLGVTETEILSHPVLLTFAVFLAIAVDARRLVSAEAA